MHGSAYSANSIKPNDGLYFDLKHGVSLAFTDGEQFINIVKNGKLLWRQFVGLGQEKRIRSNENRRVYFEDSNKNGIPDFGYSFENFPVNPDIRQPATFWTTLVPPNESKNKFEPQKWGGEDAFGFFYCVDLGERCTFIFYQENGRCAEVTAQKNQICAKGAANSKERLLLRVSSPAPSKAEWDWFFSALANRLDEEYASKMQYAVGHEGVSVITVPHNMKSLELWVQNVRINKDKVLLFLESTGNEKINAYLVKGDEAKVLNRNGARYLIRFRGSKNTTVGWINSEDVAPVE